MNREEWVFSETGSGALFSSKITGRLTESILCDTSPLSDLETILTSDHVSHEGSRAQSKRRRNEEEFTDDSDINISDQVRDAMQEKLAFAVAKQMSVFSDQTGRYLANVRTQWEIQQAIAQRTVGATLRSMQSTVLLQQEQMQFNCAQQQGQETSMQDGTMQAMLLNVLHQQEQASILKNDVRNTLIDLAQQQQT